MRFDNSNLIERYPHVHIFTILLKSLSLEYTLLPVMRDSHRIRNDAVTVTDVMS